MGGARVAQSFLQREVRFRLPICALPVPRCDEIWQSAGKGRERERLFPWCVNFSHITLSQGRNCGPIPCRGSSNSDDRSHPASVPAARVSNLNFSPRRVLPRASGGRSTSTCPLPQVPCLSKVTVAMVPLEKQDVAGGPRREATDGNVCQHARACPSSLFAVSTGHLFPPISLELRLGDAFDVIVQPRERDRGFVSVDGPVRARTMLFPLSLSFVSRSTSPACL